MTGVVDRYQELIAQGLSRSEIAGQVRRRERVRLRRGAFVDPAPPTSPEAGHLDLIRATIPLLAAASVLSHASAAVLHDLPVPRQALKHVHVTRSSGGRISRHTHRHEAPLPPDAVTEIRGFRVTSLARTVVDLGRWLAYADAVAVMDAALGRGLDRDDLDREVERARRRPGNQRARRAAAFADARSESPGESRSRVLMAQLGLPMPQLQREFVNAQGLVDARVDFDWEEFGACGEFDGQVKYGRLRQPGTTLEQTMIFEKEREERLRQHGCWTIRWKESFLHEPEAFRRLIKTGLANGIRARQAARSDLSA